MSKYTDHDIKDPASLRIVHNLQHPTSHPTTNSWQTTIVNASLHHIQQANMANQQTGPPNYVIN
jgi:hypothetical protein